jgi:hypothetical protein
LTRDQLYDKLKKINATKVQRTSAARLILSDLHLIKPLLEIVFSVDDKISCKAAWVLEFVCAEDLSPLISYLDLFTSQLKYIHMDSAMRPVAKICSLLLETTHNSPSSHLKFAISPYQKEAITEACFNWMLEDVKVATKVYAMNCLYLLGIHQKWIHHELLQILEKEYYHQSAGYQSRARQILKKLS